MFSIGMGGTTTPWNGVNPKSQFYNLSQLSGLIVVFMFSMVTPSNKIYDLKERTILFAKDVIEYVDKLPKKVSGKE
jgi:hypothetical protein